MVKYILRARTVLSCYFHYQRLGLIVCKLKEHHTIPYAGKARTQQFTRRKSNLVKKADQLARLCHADLALIIRRNGRYYTYRSTAHERWPPTMTEIVCINTIRRPWADASLESIVPIACQPTVKELWPRWRWNVNQIGCRGLIESDALICSDSFRGLVGLGRSV